MAKPNRLGNNKPLGNRKRIVRKTKMKNSSNQVQTTWKNKTKSNRRQSNEENDNFLQQKSRNEDSSSEEKGDKLLSDDSESENRQASVDHKAALNRLKENDPEFYQYLEKNDPELINFDESESDDGEEDEDDARKEKFHHLPSKLDVDSDDSEFSEEELEQTTESKSGRTKVTSALVAKWKMELEKKPDAPIIRKVSAVIHAAVLHAKDDSAVASSKYIVEDSSVFNGVMRLCVVAFLPAVHKYLKLPSPTISKADCKAANVSKNRNWKRIVAPMKTHLTDMIEILSTLTETDVIVLLLRHILHLIPFYLTFVKHSRLLLQKMVSFWCMGEESVRVLAFLCIMRTVRALPPNYLDYILKKMYMSYVSNCKFTSPSTWPLINFMKRSLVELYSLDPSVAYQHAFVYIRQLAIHLRNAITLKKKDSFQAVYNWQFVHCLLLWEHLLSTVHPNEVLKPLIYPLTQIMLGTSRLIPTGKYCPLRFQLTRSLTQLSKNTDTFIPVLPLILETLEYVHTEKMHKNLSMKPLDFSCSLKLSKSQLQENGFKNAIVENIYEHTMDYLNAYSHTIGFPELVLPAVLHFKKFLKTCKVANYCRQVKQLLEKIEENRKFIEERRKRFTSSIADFEAIKQWENQCKADETPLTKYYVTWRKLKDREILSGIAQKEKNPSEDLPVIKRQEMKKMKAVDTKEMTTLFESDSEDMDFTINTGSGSEEGNKSS